MYADRPTLWLGGYSRWRPLHNEGYPRIRIKKTFPNMVRILTTIIGLGMMLTAWSQALPEQGEKGSFFLHWGYNRAWFSTSDIHFDGPGYDFTLREVVAKDRPIPFGKDYFKPVYIWIPQYNYRIGYFFKDQWSLSLGLDHMKYVVVQNQLVSMDGHVDAGLTAEGSALNGPLDVTLTKDFLRYEHSDGLNLLAIDLDHYSNLISTASGKPRLRFLAGVHAGPVIARSDVRLFGDGINNRFNVAGFGGGAQMGFQLNFLKYFYVSNTLRAGWIDLPTVLTTGRDADHAHQHFWFAQHAIFVGGQFRFGK